MARDIYDLIEAIEANPADTVARFALADLYEEQGEPELASYARARALANLTPEERKQYQANRLGN